MLLSTAWLERMALDRDMLLERMAMDRDQIPRQRNFTELGFAKLRAPKAVYEAAREFWDLHRETQTSESWPPGNTYVNHWVADSTMCSFEDRRLLGAAAAVESLLGS